MTDKEFVLSIYEDAKYITWISNRHSGSSNDSSIELTDNGKYRSVGWNADDNEEMTWWYCRIDIEREMLRKLEQ
jgi:hypothetical protein